MTAELATRNSPATNAVPGATPLRRPKLPGLKRISRGVLLPAGAIIVLLVLWQLIVVIAKVPAYVLPAPTVVATDLGTQWPLIWTNLWVTMQEVLFGFLWGVVIAIPVALILALISPVRDALYPLLVILQVMPKIAVAPLFVIWFGIGPTAVTFLTFLLCFFPILVSSMTGFMTLDYRMLYLTRTMGASLLQTVWYLRLQSALPFIFSGLRIGIVFATTGAIVGEFVGSTAGLGFMLSAASGLSDTGKGLRPPRRPLWRRPRDELPRSLRRMALHALEPPTNRNQLTSCARVVTSSCEERAVVEADGLLTFFTHLSIRQENLHETQHQLVTALSRPQRQWSCSPSRAAVPRHPDRLARPPPPSRRSSRT
ncbi:MAG: ABC transporter permease [Galbitalea sp.]